jgi:hypothetical protein
MKIYEIVERLVKNNLHLFPFFIFYFLLFYVENNNRKKKCYQGKI